MAEAAKENVSLLERSLSLAKNGGIYYGGARVKPNEHSAVLFVGLGGTGADALIRIKDQIKTRMILPTDPSGAPLADTPPNIGFLEIDTDEDAKKVSYGSSRFNSYGNEFCPISATKLPDVIEHIKKEKERGVEYWQWFDDDVTPEGGSHGAGGTRQIGRMLLALNIGRVVEAVEGKIWTLTHDKPEINELLICMFSGISGGTGAGTFLDMAYILKKIAERSCGTVKTMGYLVMTDVSEKNGGKTEDLRRNGFACLKELDYWMSSEEHTERYCQKFPNGFELNESGKPFNFCHLLNLSDDQGHHFNYNKILRSVAENVFAYISGEVTGSTSTGTMAQLYDNIKGYTATTADNAQYPACYQYLSLGASKIEIPYTEISTLIAARVFERLNQGMFRNRPTESQFNRDVYTRLELTEENIRSALYKQVIAKPELDAKHYRYADIWPSNAPYQAAYNWLAQFQRAVVQETGNLPAKLEGNFREYIKSNLKDPKTGPVYLCYFVNSNQNYCLDKMLEKFKIYCRELQAQCAGDSKRLKDEMQQAYVEGNNLGFGKSKSAAVKKYLDAVEAWCVNEEHAFLNEKIAEVIETVQSRLKKYYERILRPLKDILDELPNIFADNVSFIKVNEKTVDEGTDILVQPLEFERTKQKEFNDAVIQAESQFLNSLSANIKKWIGHDIDEIDEDISAGVDVAGFISNFISDNFKTLLTIDMETIMSTKLNRGETLEDYIKDRVDELIQKSYPMFNKSGELGKDSVQEFATISVPSDCETIYKVTTDYVAVKNLGNRIKVKRSDEKSRMYIIKIASGYPLYANATLQDLEKAYIDQIGRGGKHLNPEWLRRLPSPYIQPVWKTPYACALTRDRDKKYKDYFDKCYRNKIIKVDVESDSCLLQCATPEVAAGVSKNNLTAPTILGKLEQFEKVKAKLWNENNVVKLPSCSQYMKVKNSEDGEKKENGIIANVKENILRFPLLLDLLEKECELADRIEKIEEELHFPKYFAFAKMNHMIFTNSITGDTVYRRTDKDPLPVKLIQGQAMHPDFKDYQIFKSFCSKLNREMKEEIELQFENLKNRIEVNPDALREYVDDIKGYIKHYEAEADKARNEMYNASKEDRPQWLDKIEFYQGSVEELQRMLPMTENAASEQSVPPMQAVPPMQTTPPMQAAPTVSPEPSERPSYLDPQTWQPIKNPQPGQQVFDTKRSQIIVYQPEPPKKIRFLDPATWQPLENPQPGQQVFDTEQAKMVIYQPEPPKKIRFLDPVTWQPLENPQPGQQVFDTDTKQIIMFNPYTAG